MKGLGKYQITYDELNKLKVIHYLTIKPYSYELLWNNSRIHRNKLRKILDYFTEKKIVLPHKLNSTDFSIFTNRKIKIKPNLTYYILNLDSKESLKHLKNVRYDQYVKDGMIFDKNYIRLNTAVSQHNKKINGKKYCFRRKKDPDVVLLNKIKQEYEIIRKMDYFFSPLLYFPKEEKDEYFRLCEKYSPISKLKDNPIQYEYYMKLLYKYSGDKNRFKQSSFKNQVINIDKILKIIKDRLEHGFTKYDILILLSWHYPSRENYLKFWELLKLYS